MEKRSNETKEIHTKWNKLYDKARYLKSEHDLKEKEYGIPWRSAYKTALVTSVHELEQQKIC